MVYHLVCCCFVASSIFHFANRYKYELGKDESEADAYERMVLGKKKEEEDAGKKKKATKKSKNTADIPQCCEKD